MRVRQVSASPLYQKIRFTVADHPITIWAGSLLPPLYCEQIGLRATPVPLLASFTKTLSNQIPAMDVLLTRSYRLALGAEWFDHFTRDPLLRT